MAYCSVHGSSCTSCPEAVSLRQNEERQRKKEAEDRERDLQEAKRVRDIQEAASARPQGVSPVEVGSFGSWGSTPSSRNDTTTADTEDDVSESASSAKSSEKEDDSSTGAVVLVLILAVIFFSNKDSKKISKDVGSESTPTDQSAALAGTSLKAEKAIKEVSTKESTSKPEKKPATRKQASSQGPSAHDIAAAYWQYLESMQHPETSPPIDPDGEMTGNLRYRDAQGKITFTAKRSKDGIVTFFHETSLTRKTPFWITCMKNESKWTKVKLSTVLIQYDPQLFSLEEISREKQSFEQALDGVIVELHQKQAPKQNTYLNVNGVIYFTLKQLDDATLVLKHSSGSSTPINNLSDLSSVVKQEASNLQDSPVVNIVIKYDPKLLSNSQLRQTKKQISEGFKGFYLSFVDI